LRPAPGRIVWNRAGAGASSIPLSSICCCGMIVVVEIIKTWLNIVNLREFDTGYIVVAIMQISTIRSGNTKYVWLTELIQRSNIHS
jgi:hypothetical protein